MKYRFKNKVIECEDIKGCIVKDNYLGVGVVLMVYPKFDNVLCVEFEQENEMLHDLDGLCKDGHGFVLKPGILEFVGFKTKQLKLL